MISKEKFEEIYDKALLMCSIKCGNDMVRDAIKLYRECVEKYKDCNDKDYIKQMLKNRKNNIYCYECKCSPDIDYMYKLIKVEEVE